jgi:hypothetical protein
VAAESRRKAQLAALATDEVAPGMTPSSEDYYPVVSIAALMRILRDESLSTHHNNVIHAVMMIFKSLQLRCVPYLPQIMPQFLHVMRTCDPSFREFLFTQLGMLVSIVKQHIRQYLDDIFALVHEHWYTPLLPQIITLVEEISLALNDEFKSYLPDLIPQLLNVLHTDRTGERVPTIKVLKALEVFGTNLDDYLHLVVPAVVRLLEQVDIPAGARLRAIETLGRLCRKLHIADYASRIVHPLSRVLGDPTLAEFHDQVMETLCALVCQLGPDFAIFIAMLAKVLQKQRIVNQRYEALVAKVLKLQPLAADGAPVAGGGASGAAIGLGRLSQYAMVPYSALGDGADGGSGERRRRVARRRGRRGRRRQRRRRRRARRRPRRHWRRRRRRDGRAGGGGGRRRREGRRRRRQGGRWRRRRAAAAAARRGGAAATARRTASRTARAATRRATCRRPRCRAAPRCA